MLNNPFTAPLTLLWVVLALVCASMALAKDGPNDLKSLPRSMRDHSHPTVLVFHAPQCGTCKKMAPLEKKLAQRTRPAVKWHWFNTEDSLSDKMMNRFNVHVTPTYLLFDAEGKGVYRMETMIRPAVLRQEVLQLQANAMSSATASKEANKVLQPTGSQKK